MTGASVYSYPAFSGGAFRGISKSLFKISPLSIAIQVWLWKKTNKTKNHVSNSKFCYVYFFNVHVNKNSFDDHFPKQTTTYLQANIRVI